MQPRRLAGCLAVVLSATLLSPIVLRPTPALAHGPCTTTADTSASDYHPSAWTDTTPATSTWVRVIAPTQSGTGTCPTKPSAGWPLIVYLHGYGTNRCENMGIAARATIATWGYVVLSFTARGNPLPSSVGYSGCNADDDAKDALDDKGTDMAGARDKKDIKQLIDWVRDTYNAAPPSGCGSATNTCADTNTVGLTGFSYGGTRSWAMGVPSPTNPDWDSRVKAIAPMSPGSTFDNIKNLSSDGATPTATVRPRANSSTSPWFANQGWLAHMERGFTTHAGKSTRSSYLNQSVPTDTQAYWDDRTLVHDDATIDKAGDITIPTFVLLGWLDDNGGVYNQHHIEAYNKVNTTSKYLYLGSCAHNDSGAGDSCLTNNKANMTAALHRFFDRHVRGDTTCGSNCEVRPPGTTTCSTSGPCVIYTVPTKWVSTTDNPWYTDNWSETSATAWPPSSATTETRYFRNAGTLTTTSESGTTCTPGTPPAKGTGCSTFKNNLNLPAFLDACYGLTYDTTYEVQSYDWSFTADKKVAKFEADLYLKSDTTRQQVYVDLELLDSSGAFIRRVWQGVAQIVPIKRDGTAGTIYRFKFVPGGSGWTVANGQKLRFKVASKYAKAYAGEPLPATYTLYHNDTYRSAVTLTYVS